MYNILTYNNISETGLRNYPRANYTISKEMPNPDALMVRSAPLNDMIFPSNLKVIARVGAGFNTIPIERCTNAGICVFNTPGGNANAVKEMTLAAMITIMRRVDAAREWLKGLEPSERSYGKAVEMGKEMFTGPEILGKQIGILGLGAIGSRMAKACSDLGMTVVGYDPYLTHIRKNELSQFVKFVDDPEELYKTSDVVTVHVPLEPATRGMVGKKQLGLMKTGSYLLNYARGPIVDNDAVVEALEAGKLKAYATDFPTEAEIVRDDCFCTPHLASGTPEAEENCAVMAVRQTRDYLENGNISHSVNFPDVSFARADGDRITILHKNKVGMLGNITEKCAAMGLNIENLVNKARGDIAYTILDFNDTIPEELGKALEEIDSVIKVRIIPAQ